MIAGDPDEGRRIMSAANAMKVSRMLEGVLQAGGTASEAAIEGYTLAGKTGTAQKAENGGYSKTDFVASFIGFAPSRSPRLLVSVMVDEPQRLDLRRRGGRARVREDRVLRPAVPEDPSAVGGLFLSPASTPAPSASGEEQSPYGTGMVSVDSVWLSSSSIDSGIGL